MSDHHEYPTLRYWHSGGKVIGLAADQMEVEVAAVLREVQELRAEVERLTVENVQLVPVWMREVTRERALADQLADAVHDALEMMDPVERAMALPYFADVLDAWEAARHE